MPFASVDGARLYYRLEGDSGEPLVLVHGSWGDHHNWDLVAPGLATHFRVLRYDRRGHSQSEQIHAWEQLPHELQQTFVGNALTWLDEVHDPDALSIDVAALSHFPHVALVSNGDQSPAFFPIIVDMIAKALPNTQRKTFVGAGHVPHTSHPVDYVDAVLAFAQ